MKTNFDQAINDLTDICKQIINFAEKENPFSVKKEKKKGSKNQPQKALSNYLADYLLSEEENNKEDVLVTYKKIRVPLLKGWKNDEWLKLTPVSIYSGAIEPDDSRRIMLSTIYTLACQYRDQTKVVLKDLPVQAYDNHEELLFPAKFQLYMYRAFLYCLNENTYPDDIANLTAIVNELEKELKIEPVNTSKALGTVNGSGSTASQQRFDPSMMSGFFDLAKDIMTKMNINIPEGTQMPSNPNQVMEAASSVFTSPDTKDFIAEIGQSMKDSQNFGDALQKVMGKIQDPNTIERFKQMATNLIPTETMTTSDQSSGQNNATN